MGILEAFAFYKKLKRYVEKVEEIDAALAAVETGQTVGINFPDELDLKFKTRSGKRMSLDGGIFKRLS